MIRYNSHTSQTKTISNLDSGDQYTNVALSSAHTESRDVGTDATNTQDLIPKRCQAQDPLPLSPSDTGESTTSFTLNVTFEI